MPVVSPERLAELQRNAEDIRNICILAHVDHGKTSLTDALIATNGIISPRLAGKIRYLDSRPDEQLRGITMESSAISLCFSMAHRPAPDAAPVPRDYLINLIDSPGHVDFSSEVSTASRLCDGALILVDAVEGVQSQTVTVLRQAWLERLQPLLVINKIDRLVGELQMSAGEAYTHLARLVEEVNAVLGSFFQGERMEEDLQWRERMDERVAAAAAKEQARARRNSSGGATDDAETATTASTEDAAFEERDDEDLYFAPERNNIVFCSATDGWAFTVAQFATLYERKLGIKRAVLEKVLWGDFYLEPKTKRVLSSKHLKGRALKPMFVQLVLDNIWAVYAATTGGAHGKGDPTQLTKILTSLSLSLPAHTLRSKDPRTLLLAIFAAWLPVSTAVLVSIVARLPSPRTAQRARMRDLVAASPGGACVDGAIVTAMSEFDVGEHAPVVGYVSKMVAVPHSELPENKRRGGMSAEEAREAGRRKRAEVARARAAAEAAEAGAAAGAGTGTDTGTHAQAGGVSVVSGALSALAVTDDSSTTTAEPPDEPDALVGFARLYSGTLAVGDRIYVLPPKYTPAAPYAPPRPTQVTVTALYLLMGRTLEALQSVPAGCVFGIGGLAGHVLKNGTLCSSADAAPNLAGVSMGGAPIVRIALEPADPRDLGKMIAGLKLLEQSDPCARYEVLESGEHVVATAGELHFERCLKDLRERFARCDIQAGAPIVPYRESIVQAAEMNPPRHKELPRGTVVAVSASRQLTLRLRVRPLPAPLTACIDRHAATLRALVAEQKGPEIAGAEGAVTAATAPGANDHDALTAQVVDPAAVVAAAVDGDDHPAAPATGTRSAAEFRQALRDAVDEVDEHPEVWRAAIEHITAFGPRRVGPNLLIDATKDAICRSFWDAASHAAHHAPSTGTLAPVDLADRIAYAFQLATAQGPLCQEPLQGVAVFLEDVQIGAPASAAGDGDGAPSASLDAGRLTGETIRTTRDALRDGFLDWSPRLLLAMYSCEIQAGADVLGKVYGVVTRRRGKILAEALHEGTPFFTIVALLPVAESFGFATEMRNRTSGNASPQLRFAGFVALDQDPFWVPSTDDELEDLGELADRENVAKRYVDAVRRRKGLLVKELRRVEGEKARTLKK